MLKKLFILICLLVPSLSFADTVNNSGLYVSGDYGCAVGNMWGMKIIATKDTAIKEIHFNPITVFDKAYIYTESGGLLYFQVASDSFSSHVAYFNTPFIISSSTVYYVVADLNGGGSTANCVNDDVSSIPHVSTDLTYMGAVFLSGNNGSSPTTYNDQTVYGHKLSQIDSIITYLYVAPVPYFIVPLTVDDMVLSYAFAGLISLILVILIKLFSHFVRL
jgi:hypothetical protein